VAPAACGRGRCKARQARWPGAVRRRRVLDRDSLVLSAADAGARACIAAAPTGRHLAAGTKRLPGCGVRRGREGAAVTARWWLAVRRAQHIQRRTETGVW
jgi:hypothetical protein